MHDPHDLLCPSVLTCATACLQSLAALTGGADSWGSATHSSSIQQQLSQAMASQAAAAAASQPQAQPQPPLRALSSSSGEFAPAAGPAGFDPRLAAELAAMQMGGGGGDVGMPSTSYGSAVGGVPHVGSAGALSDAGLPGPARYGSGNLPQGASLSNH